MLDNKEQFSLKKAILFLVLIGCGIYFKALFGKFVWDDIAFIATNPDVHSFNIIHLFGQNMFNSSGYYRPLSAVYFAILYNVFGSTSFFYHVIQISLHILNTCLLYIFFNRYFKRIIVFFLALLFLVHPIQVESVAYIGATQCELVFLFGISALLISMKEKLFVQDKIFIFLLLSLSVFTKEVGIFFIVLLLLYQYLYKKDRVLSFLPLLIAVPILYALIRFAVAGVFLEKIDFIPIAQLPVAERLLSLPKIIFYYIQTLFFPAQLAIEQHWFVKDATLWNFYLPLVIDILFFVLLGIFGYYVFGESKRVFKVFLFFLVWFLGGFCMLLQIFPLDMTVADRWFYFPIGGFLGCIGAILNEIELKKAHQMIAMFVGVAAIICFSIRTEVRIQNWQNSIALYSHDIKLEGNFDNENNYAAALSYENKWDEALEHVKRSVYLYPYEKNLRELGLVYKELGQKKLAKQYFYEALSAKSFVSPHQHELQTYEYIIKFQYLYGDVSEAVRVANRAVKDYPDNSGMWVLLAISEYKLKHSGNALDAAEKAWALERSQITAYVYRQILNNLPLSITSSF